MHGFNQGDRVWWSDPDEGIASGAGTVIDVQSQDDDAVILLQTEHGETEALPHELTLLNPVLERTLAARLQLSDCHVEVRLHTDGKVTGHYRSGDRTQYENIGEMTDRGAKVLAERAVGQNAAKIEDMVRRIKGEVRFLRARRGQ